MTSHYPITPLTDITEDDDALIELTEAADICGLHPEMIEEFLRGGLVSAFRSEEEIVYFDHHGLTRLRQISHFRYQEHANLRTIRYILSLLETLDSREQELRELRERLR
ncbi:MAG: MerR family transcriptional regulator [Verrucomicrobiae bacterium]|nr:MerR family transcriptional regulator [Verrucomicrobiae bacterium]NNJ87218.1 MerR family transcriptional regulator [Akkermansiaceae bacterium]